MERSSYFPKFKGLENGKVRNKVIYGTEREDRFQNIKEGVENDQMEATGIFHSIDNGNQSKKNLDISQVQVKLSSHR